MAPKLKGGKGEKSSQAVELKLKWQRFAVNFVE